MLTDFGGFHMDITTYTMLLVCKLWILAWEYKDGAEPESKLSKHQIENRVKELPGLLEYLSFVFFAPACIVGPAFEFTDFTNLIELKGVYATLPRGLASGWQVILPSILEIVGGFICLGIHIGFIMQGFDIYWCGSTEFLTYKNMFMRIGYSYVAMTSQRFMYYTPWKLVNGGIIASGLGWNGVSKSGSNTWDRIFAIDVIGVETCTTCVKMMALWNHSVHVWLKHYV